MYIIIHTEIIHR